MTRSLWIAALALAACDGRTLYEIKADCLTFNSPTLLNVDALAFNVRLARATMSPVVPPEEFCKAFSDSYIEIRPVKNWDCHTWNDAGQLSCITGFTGLNGVELNWDVNSLAHELLHVWDFAHGDVLSSNHHGWLESGRYAIESEYDDAHKDPRIE